MVFGMNHKLFTVDKIVEFKNLSMNFLFPLRCHNCMDYLPYQPVKHLCEKCEKELYSNISVVCRICSKEAGPNDEAPYLCGDCRFKKEPSLKTISVGKYDGILKNLIHQLKYSMKQNVSVTLSRLLLDFLKVQKIDIDKYDAAIPMPIAKVKKRERGFNQTELICADFADYYNIPVINKILTRKYNPKPQVSLNRRERLINPQDSFTLSKNYSVNGKSFILVDDVKSTGSTLFFASSILFDAGACEVLCVTLANNA